MIRKWSVSIVLITMAACCQMTVAQTCQAVDAVTKSTLKLLATSQRCETSATLNWSYSETNGTRTLTYGKTTSYGTAGGNVSSSTSSKLTGLTANTTYYFQVDNVYKGSTKYLLTGSFMTTGGSVIAAPTFANATAAVTCTTGTTKTYTASATGTGITYSISGQPSWITLSNAALTLKPVTGSANATVTITATNTGGSAIQTLTVTVVNAAVVVEPPVFANATAAVTCTTGTTKTYTATATDPANKTLTYTFSNSSSGALPTWITSSGATLTFKPVTGSQNATVKIIASNGTADDTQNLTITVVEGVTILPPAITSDASLACTTNTVKTYTATATGGLPISFTFKSLTFGTLPSWMSASNATLTLSPLSSSQSSTVKVIATNSVSADTLDLAVTVVPTTAVNKHAVSGKYFTVNIGSTPISIPFSNEKTITVSLYSLDGSLVLKKDVTAKNAKSSSVSFNTHLSGTYMCKITSRSGELSQRIVLQK
jgi:hypothetical protein